ncbi:MAG: glycosyltransferase family 9 protein, partial [Acidobacteriota bacterium]
GARALRQAGLTEDQLIVAFAPGAAWSYRRWPADRFIALGRWLQETSQAAVLVFAAKNERELADQVARGLIAERTVNLAGQTTIRQMAAILRRCRLFVGNDSGPMHVAAASGVPVVGLFGAGEFERFRPWGFEHAPVRAGLPCSPCSQDCAFSDPRCIRGISLEQAKKAVARLLESSA